MKSPLPENLLRTFAPLALALALLASPACSRKAPPAPPSLSDPAAGVSIVLPPSASSFRRPPASDRFVSRVPYAPRQTLLSLHAYTVPAPVPDAPPDFHDDLVERILRDELGSFLVLETSFTNLADQTPAVLVYGRAREPDQVAGFAFQCNKTHFVFVGLSGPEIAPADAAAFFLATAPNLSVADVSQHTFADADRYRSHLVALDDPAAALEYVRNVFASRNANPLNYVVAINLAYLLAQNVHANDPSSPRLPETVSLLDNMVSIRLADYLKARTDFEIACGQRNAPEALAQARFLSDLSFPFDSEALSLADQRIRKANSLQ